MLFVGLAAAGQASANGCFCRRVHHRAAYHHARVYRHSYYSYAAAYPPVYYEDYYAPEPVYYGPAGYYGYGYGFWPGAVAGFYHHPYYGWGGHWGWSGHGRWAYGGGYAYHGRGLHRGWGH